MRIRSLLLLLCTVGFSILGQSQVVETSKGKVEFIGFEQWTPALVQAKLGYASTEAMHYCAAELRTKLGFPDSVVVAYREDGKLYTVITVVETQYAAGIRYRPEPSTTSPAPDEWLELLSIVEQKKYMNSLLSYGQSLAGAIKLEKPPVQDSDNGWWHLLQQRRSEKDYQQALRRLASDGDFRNRVIAALILTNFSARNAAWLALMDGVRDKNPLVNLTCYQALITLMTYVPRRVDWVKAAPTIYHILNGTNLFAFSFVLNTLTKTEVSAKLAPRLLRNGGARLLLAYLKANHKDERDLARQFLIQLSGKDFGYDSERWRTWIESVAPVSERTPLTNRIARSIRHLEPEWRYSYGWCTCPPTVLGQVWRDIGHWERKDKQGRRESVEVWIVLAASSEDSAAWINNFAHNIPHGACQLESYQLSDEAYLLTCPATYKSSLNYRRGRYIVEVRGASQKIVERFAKYAAVRLPAR